MKIRPFSLQFNQHYWSGGAPEKHHVFIAGNALPQRLSALPETSTFTIAELGFGTGLNFLLTMHLADKLNKSIHYISFEQHHLPPHNLPDLHQDHSELAPQLAMLLTQYNPVSGWNYYIFSNITLSLFVGDATLGLPTMPAAADAWFLDGFSPDVNPNLWTESLFYQVYAHTNPGGTAATYSAAGTVKHALRAAGFTVRRAPGFPPKRHMLTISKD